MKKVDKQKHSYFRVRKKSRTEKGNLCTQVISDKKKAQSRNACRGNARIGY